MLSSWLKDGPVLTDGAWGTELQAQGLAVGKSPDWWNLEHPERVERVARAYVEAGSRVILTNTFRSNAIALGDGADIRRLNEAGVAISRRAGEGRVKVVASAGPMGRMLFAGEVSAWQVQAAFREQMRAQAEAGADALLVETVSDVEEACIAVEAGLETGLPVIVSFTFGTAKNKDRTMTGATPEAAASAMEGAGAHAVGANCGAGIEYFASLCARMKNACGLPVWMKPNAGLPEVGADGIRYDADADQFATHVAALVAAGASFVGGCCGSTPAFIRAASARLQVCVAN